jgi:tRNA (mo5U34)-methyltransferase
VQQTQLFEQLCKLTSVAFASEVLRLSDEEFAKKNGNKAKWEESLQQLQNITPLPLTLTPPYLTLNTSAPESAFKNLRPWRKGPFAFANFNLDSEWNGHIKWQRLHNALDFENKLVLDVGCGNGYFSLLMALSGVKFVLGLEPFLLFNYQFRAIQSLTTNTTNTTLLPLKLEQIPTCPQFDIVFSMGVLYHSKSPIEHILKLKQMLTAGGELVLETLIVEGAGGYSLTPVNSDNNRYAKMRNVWFIPSKLTLIHWLKRCGFNNITVLDDSVTTTDEQRKTKWISEHSESLIDFLDTNNPHNTIEGYPRPRRLMLLCKL